MCKILFRCRLKDNGEWVYWDMVGRITTPTGKISKYTRKTKYGESYYHFAHQIWDMLDRATIGRATILPAKNGKRIFEGDVVKVVGFETWVNGEYVVEFNDTSHCWWLSNPYPRECSYSFSDLNGFHADCEVIGNIYDHPEILGGGGDAEH